LVCFIKQRNEKKKQAQNKKLVDKKVIYHFPERINATSGEVASYFRKIGIQFKFNIRSGFSLICPSPGSYILAKFLRKSNVDLDGCAETLLTFFCGWEIGVESRIMGNGYGVCNKTAKTLPYCIKKHFLLPEVLKRRQ
jgi:hypothetical protein